ncbi:MAG: glycerophosphodiester phosphodiesterase [Gammaproteobacteria bacterium]|nr:glycerophosphodiester phosphodiesterase [Gammaproteobacteria bacterium]
MICIGHRGARGHAPENTLAAIAIGIEQGAQWIEIDVRAHEGELLVIHDNELDRTTNGHGALTQYSLTQLRQLDAGDGQKIPLLSEVLALVNRRAIVNIELKDSASAALVLALIKQHLSKGWHCDDFVVSSFFHHDLQWLKGQFPALKIAALSASVGLDYAKFAQQLDAWSINLNVESLNQAIIDDAHQRGLKVLVYTVNKPSKFQQLLHMGIDGIFTDYPLEFNQWLTEQEKQ